MALANDDGDALIERIQHLVAFVDSRCDSKDEQFHLELMQHYFTTQHYG